VRRSSKRARRFKTIVAIPTTMAPSTKPPPEACLPPFPAWPNKDPLRLRRSAGQLAQSIEMDEECLHHPGFYHPLRQVDNPAFYPLAPRMKFVLHAARAQEILSRGAGVLK
jgi:hypothetical protein